MAGRLKKIHNENENDGIEINCSAEGALFIVADSSSVMNDDFASTPKFIKRLLPTVDYSSGISSFPLLLVQITHFKCGGVAIGFRVEHHVADGFSSFHFISTWSDMAHGLGCKIPPSIDRTVLRARDPPRTLLNHNHHLQYLPRSDHVQQESATETTTSIFRFTREQINKLKAHIVSLQSKYSSHEVFAGHVWRCSSKARELADDQETELYIPINGRSRLQPPLPPGYLGNVVFGATTGPVLAGDLISKPLWYAANCIHKALVLVDNDYLRSDIDYLKLQKAHQDLLNLAHGAHIKFPNLALNSWSALPLYGNDFGWGLPTLVGGTEIRIEGKGYILSNANNDGGLSL